MVRVPLWTNVLDGDIDLEASSPGSAVSPCIQAVPENKWVEMLQNRDVDGKSKCKTTIERGVA